MRPALPLVLFVLVLAGCSAPAPPPAPSAGAGPPTPTATPTGTPTATPPDAPSSATAPRLGVLFEETYAYEGKSEEVRRRFTVDRGVERILFYVETGGPPADGSFTSAVMDVYAPRSTGAMFAELPAQQPARNYTLQQTGSEHTWGEWTVRFAGTGKTSVTLRVTAE